MEMQHETKAETGGEERLGETAAAAEAAATTDAAVMPPPTEEEEEGASISNQETEIAAMMKEGHGFTFDTPTTKSMKFESSIATAGMIFAMPATPPNRGTILLTTKSASNSRSSSLKKQRRGTNGNGAGTNGNGGGATAGQPLNYSKNSGKQSQSMTSLQPNEEEHQEHRRDVIQAKLHLERPYNSLKKNAHSGGGKCNGNKKMHRYSWGQSSQSSSTSLHSSATLGLGSSGKDDLWAAIQTNYNYIMDTNLLDTCKEARCEIEGASTVLEKSNESGLKMLDETQRPDGVLCEDPKELRRWLREMENKLEISPTITELTLYGIAELQRHLAVHSSSPP